MHNKIVRIRDHNEIGQHLRQPLLVRSACIEDADSISDLLHTSITQLCGDDHENDPAILNAWLRNKTADTVARWIEGNSSGFLIAEREGKAAGVGAITPRGEVLLNYVHPENRFQGISAVLLAKLEQLACKSGCREVKLVSTRTAFRFYSARGYQADGPAIAGIGGKPSQPMVKVLPMNDGRTVRLARQDDLPGTLALFRHLNPDDPPLDPVRADALWSDLLCRTGVHLFVIEESGLLVATCTLILVPNLTRGGRSYAFIENVVTHVDYRGRGYGRAVLDTALQAAWDEECYKVMLLTGRRDEAILRFYESAGFRRDVKTGLHANSPDRDLISQ